MIYEGSRYETATIERIVGTDGLVRETVVPQERVAGTDFQFTYYTIRAGDRMDTIAAQFFGESDMWWVIADYNPEIQYFEDLPQGVVLRVPNGLPTS